LWLTNGPQTGLRFEYNDQIIDDEIVDVVVGEIS
jgi:hypothetical protein